MREHANRRSGGNDALAHRTFLAATHSPLYRAGTGGFEYKKDTLIPNPLYRVGQGVCWWLDLCAFDFLQALLGVTHVADVLAADLELLHEFDLGNGRGVHGVDLFDTHVTRFLTDRHGLLKAGAAFVDHKSLKHLDALLELALGVRFCDLVVHPDLHPGTDLIRREHLKALRFGHNDVAG
jgi:hypothetical protein